MASSHRLVLILGALLGACSSDFAPAPPPRAGGAGGGGGGEGAGGTGGGEDSGEHDGVDDTGDTGQGSTGGEDTGPDPDPTGQVCYLGPDRDHSVCIDVVDYDPAWGADYSYPAPYDGDPQYSAPARYVDLEGLSEDLEVAPNFVLGELMQAWKGRYGVFQAHTVEAIQGLRDASGGPLTVNSGYRNVTYNASVGGVTYSRHQYGDAVDLDPSAVSLSELGELCEAYGAAYVGMYSTHVHCDWRTTELDPAFYDGASGFGPVEPAPLPLHEARILADASGVLSAPATGFDEGEPLRLWTVWDADGAVLFEGTGETLELPEGAARVEVEVGGPYGDVAVYEP